MENNTTKVLLKEHLRQEVDERLIGFTAGNAHSILYWPLERFCQMAGISDAQALEFFAAFDAPSFAAFKDLVRSILYQDVQGQGITKRSIGSITEELIETEIQNLRELANGMDYENLERLTRDLAQASSVMVMGNGGAAPYAIYLTGMLNKLGIKAYKMSNIADFSSSHDTSTLVISFGIARYSKRSVLQLRSLRQRGYRVVGFTDRQDSPWTDLSDYCFFMPLRGFDFVDSYTAGITLINALLLNIGLQDEQKLITQLHAHDASLEDLDVFF